METENGRGFWDTIHRADFMGHVPPAGSAELLNGARSVEDVVSIGALALVGTCEGTRRRGSAVPWDTLIALMRLAAAWQERAYPLPKVPKTGLTLRGDDLFPVDDRDRALRLIESVQPMLLDDNTLDDRGAMLGRFFGIQAVERGLDADALIGEAVRLTQTMLLAIDRGEVTVGRTEAAE